MRQRFGIDLSELSEKAMIISNKDSPQTKNMYKMKRFLSDRMNPLVFLRIVSMKMLKFHVAPNILNQFSLLKVPPQVSANHVWPKKCRNEWEVNEVAEALTKQRFNIIFSIDLNPTQTRISDCHTY